MRGRLVARHAEERDRRESVQRAVLINLEPHEKHPSAASVDAYSVRASPLCRAVLATAPKLLVDFFGFGRDRIRGARGRHGGLVLVCKCRRGSPLRRQIRRDEEGEISQAGTPGRIAPPAQACVTSATIWHERSQLNQFETPSHSQRKLRTPRLLKQQANPDARMPQSLTRRQKERLEAKVERLESLQQHHQHALGATVGARLARVHQWALEPSKDAWTVHPAAEEPQGRPRRWTKLPGRVESALDARKVSGCKG